MGDNMDRKVGGGQESGPQVISFTDPDTGEEILFGVEEETVLNGVKYLLVSEEAGDEEYNAYILKEIQVGEDEILYRMVDDDTEFAALARVFSELADDDTELVY
ncbi:MAG: DUF1292 domain-containing protein [Clostridiales bacterium]|nr:DUF1292 domain-containing protein [Clostridiales bacterium]